MQVGDVVVDQVRALLGNNGQLGDAGGVQVFADRGPVQTELAADRRLVQSLSGQSVNSDVVFTKAGHDLLLG